MLTGYKELEGKVPVLKFAGTIPFAAAVLVALVVIVGVANIG